MEQKFLTQYNKYALRILSKPDDSRAKMFNLIEQRVLPDLIRQRTEEVVFMGNSGMSGPCYDDGNVFKSSSDFSN